MCNAYIADKPAVLEQKSKAPYVLSFLHLCPDQNLDKILRRIGRLNMPDRYPVEHIVLRHDGADMPADGASISGTEPGGKVRFVDCGPNYDIPTLSYSLGLPACQGTWVWLWGPDTFFAVSDVVDVIETLTSGAALQTHLIWLQPPGDKTRGSDITVDQIYNGLCPAPDSLIWRADIFERWGCFDPHLAVADVFAYEMLLRIMKHVRIATLQTRDGTKSTLIPERLGDIVFYADSRTSLPTAETLLTYDVTDLSEVERKHGKFIAWRLYLEKILPYYYSHRHTLPPGLFIAPQSIPREQICALFTKVQYETCLELTFGNYELRFKGSRRFSFSYLQSQMLRGMSGGQPDIHSTGRVDVLVSTRTSDNFNTLLLRQANAAECATAYLTDDDFLTFHEYGGDFAAFCPGSPRYEAMVKAIEAADVVIGFSDQIERSVSRFNKRYVSCDVSVPLELLPKRPAKTASRVFHFGYAGGNYRTEEFAMLRPAIERIAREYGDAVKFSFWGLNPSDLEIEGNVELEYVPFSSHYFEYLERLTKAGFDAMLVPLMAEPTPKKAKNHNKFIEAAIANAVGLYSDLPNYGIVRHGVTGIKVKAETTEAWYEAMRSVLDMPAEELAKIRSNALDYVRIFCSTPALAWTSEAGLLAARLHKAAKNKRLADGRPLVAFFLPTITGTGGGAILLWRSLEIARRLGLRALVVISSLWAKADDLERVSKFLGELGAEYELVA